MNQLVEQALRANPDIDAADAALRAAQENARAQRGAYYPQVQAGFSPSRQQSSATLSPPLASNDTLYSLYTAQVGVSYAPDVFGQNGRQVEALLAQADYQRFQLQAAYLSLTTNVVGAAVQEATLRAQLAAMSTVERIQGETLELLDQQFQHGAIAKADVVAQQAALAQTRAAVVPLQKQLAQVRDLLARLTGRFPSDEPSQQFELVSLQLPQELPVSLPSTLVDQRPDVLAAEALLHSATAQVGVATAAMLPQFSISGDIGSVAARLAQLGSGAAGMWLVAGSVSQTLFAGGALEHRKQAAAAVMDQAAAVYRGVVLNAFQNVADTLRALQYDAEAVRAQAAAEQAGAESLRIARAAQRLGSISYLTLLNAEQTYQQALVNLAQAQGSRFADTAALFQALGGGWSRDAKTPRMGS